MIKVILRFHRNRVILIHLFFRNFSIYDYHLVFKKLVDKKNDKVKFDNIPKTNEEYMTVTHSFI